MRGIVINSFVLGIGLCVGAAMAQRPSPSPGPMPSGNPGQTNPNQPGGNNPGAVPESASNRINDRDFARDATLGGMTEVEMGKLATEKASSDAVKQFGQKLVDDHTKANDQLKEIAGKENISIPDALDSKHQSRVDKLSKLSGDAFDKAFIKDQVKDHEQDVNEFKSEAQNGSDAVIKQFASNTLPTLQEHLNMAKDLSKSEKKKGK